MSTHSCQASAKRRRLALAILLIAGSGCATSKPKFVTSQLVNPSVTATASHPTSIATKASPYQLAGWQSASDVDNREDETEANDESGKGSAASDTMSMGVVVAEPYMNSSALSVESCVLIAVQSHPKVAAARARVVAAQNRIPQARALAESGRIGLAGRAA
ncbi:MAG: hypothetical protein ABI557_09220, partial [Aureliella sp.]